MREVKLKVKTIIFCLTLYNKSVICRGRVSVVNGPKLLSPTPPELDFSNPTRIVIHQPVSARFKPEIEDVASNFEKKFIKKQMSFTHAHCCSNPAIAKTLSLAENRNFDPASDTINARHFFQIQAELDPTRKS